MDKRIRQKQSLVWPGVIRGVYVETKGGMANLPQLEDYHIIDMGTMEHLLVIWCHGIPENRRLVLMVYLCSPGQEEMRIFPRIYCILY